MKVFRKNVSHLSESQIYKEVILQERAHLYLACCPKIVATDYKTFIDMEDLEEMNIADKYGEDFSSMPEYIINDIYKIIKKLYLECDIEYIDITPYNFIEKDNIVYVIDFGDAKWVNKNWFLQEMFCARGLEKWNPDFR